MSNDLGVKFVILGSGWNVSGFCPNTHSITSGVQSRRLNTADDGVCVCQK